MMLTDTSEVWKQVPDLDYEASTLGRIRRRKTGYVIEPFVYHSYGYHSVNIYRDGWSKAFPVHVLVAITFHGPRPPKHDIDHIDGNQVNNEPGNLEYVTHRENMRRSTFDRKGMAHPNAKLTDDMVREIRRMDREGACCLDMIAKFNIERKALYNVRKGITWKHVDTPTASADARCGPRRRRGVLTPA